MKKPVKNVKLDKKKVSIGIIVLIIVVLLVIFIFKPGKIKCTQTNDIKGVTNKNTIEIVYKKDKVKEVTTTFNYVAKSKDKESIVKQIKTSMNNLGKVYKDIDGVEYKNKKDKSNEYEVVQIVNFDEISDKDLSNINIPREFKKAKSSYEAAGFSCK